MNTTSHLVGEREGEMFHDTAEKVEQRSRDGRVRSYRMVHDEDGRLDVHDVVRLRVEEQPIVEEREFGVGGVDVGSASGEEPSDDGPSRNDIGTKHFVWRMDDATNISN